MSHLTSLNLSFLIHKMEIITVLTPLGYMRMKLSDASLGSILGCNCSLKSYLGLPTPPSPTLYSVEVPVMVAYRLSHELLLGLPASLDRELSDARCCISRAWHLCLWQWQMFNNHCLLVKSNQEQPQNLGCMVA